jgi:hypothetical protein
MLKYLLLPLVRNTLLKLYIRYPDIMHLKDYLEPYNWLVLKKI